MSTSRIRHAALVLAALPLASVACGICIEDKVAATYDDAVVSKAMRDHHAVMFFEMIGTPPAAAGQQRALVQSVESVRGVNRGSVRFSAQPAALSFATTADVDRIADTGQAVNRKLTDQHLRLKLVRIFYQGELRAP